MNSKSSSRERELYLPRLPDGENYLVAMATVRKNATTSVIKLSEYMGSGTRIMTNSPGGSTLQ